MSRLYRGRSARAYGAHRDAVEPAIVAELQSLGCSVQPLNGKDIPDLLVGVPLPRGGGVNVLLEAKTGSAQLKPGQAKWHAAWRGSKPHVIRTAAHANRLVRMLTEDPDVARDTPASARRGTSGT
jgi:hypothetical protein